MTDGLSQSLQGVKAQVDSAMRDIASGTAAMLASFGLYGKGFLQQSIAEARDFQATMARFKQLFAENAQEAENWGTKFAESLGKGKGAILDAMGTYQGFGKGLGFSSEEATAFSKRITELGVDLAAFADIADKDAFWRLRAALSGSAEVLDQFGINIKMDALEEFLGKSSATATEAEKYVARIKAIEAAMKRMGAQGQAKREMDQVGERMKRLAAAATTLKINIGTSLLEPMGKIADVSAMAVGTLAQLAGEFPELISSALVGSTAFGLLGASIFGAYAASRLLGFSWKKVFIGSGIGAIVLAVGAAVGILTQKLSENEEVVKLVNEIFQNLKTTWEDLRGVWEETAESIKSKATEVLGIAIEKVKEFLDWTSLMTTDWDLTWSLMKTTSARWLLVIADKALMLFNTIKAAAIGAGSGMWSAMKDSAYNIGMTFQNVVRAIMGLFKGLWAGIKNKFKGGSFLDSFKEAYQKEAAKMNKNLKPVGENASKAFTDSFVKHMGKDSPFKEEIDTLAKEGDRIKKEMEKARQIKRDDAAMDAFVGPINQEEQKSPAQQAAETFKAVLEAGRYGFAEIGNKIQDTLLKDKENDEQKKQTGLLEAGLTKQDDLIKAVKESGMKPGVLT